MMFFVDETISLQVAVPYVQSSTYIASSIVAHVWHALLGFKALFRRWWLPSEILLKSPLAHCGLCLQARLRQVADVVM
jgi:hypothetical protein